MVIPNSPLTKEDFLSSEGRCEAYPVGVLLFLLMFYFGLVKLFFNLEAVFCRKKSLKMFYPPKGRLLADSYRGPIVFTYVLSRERTSVCRLLKGSNYFYLCFILGQ